MTRFMLSWADKPSVIESIASKPIWLLFGSEASETKSAYMAS